MDFGMVGRLDEWMKERLGVMLFNIVRKDVNGIVRVLIEIGDPQKKVDKHALKRDIYRLFDKYCLQNQSSGLEHQNFSKLISRLNLVGNRISFSLIVAEIIVGSSLIAQRSPQSLLWRFPIAEAGFVIAVLLGIWLLISIILSRKI